MTKPPRRHFLSYEKMSFKEMYYENIYNDLIMVYDFVLYQNQIYVFANDLPIVLKSIIMLR